LGVLKEEREGISKDYLTKLVLYMPNWCADVIANNGIWTSTK
jgi:hypothetical protein